MALLRRLTGLPNPPSVTSSKDICMNVSEFAVGLDRLRENVGKPALLPNFRRLDNHIIPQDYYFDEIDYHLVLDIEDWEDHVKTAPILDRLPYADVVRNHQRITHMHSSGENVLLIPDKAALSIHRFAVLSKPGQLKYMSSP